MNKPGTQEPIVMDRYDNEADIWRDAWRIADPGASNPTAVARTLFRASSFLNHEIGTDATRKHQALRLIAAQLAFLFNVNSDGGGGFGDDEAVFIVDVKSIVDKLERGYPDLCFICGAYSDFPCRELDSKGMPISKRMREDHPRRAHTVDRDFTDYDANPKP